jgi:hypothetical protein
MTNDNTPLFQNFKDESEFPLLDRAFCSMFAIKAAEGKGPKECFEYAMNQTKMLAMFENGEPTFEAPKDPIKGQVFYKGDRWIYYYFWKDGSKYPVVA